MIFFPFRYLSSLEHLQKEPFSSFWYVRFDQSVVSFFEDVVRSWSWKSRAVSDKYDGPRYLHYHYVFTRSNMFPPNLSIKDKAPWFSSHHLHHFWEQKFQQFLDAQAAEATSEGWETQGSRCLNALSCWGFRDTRPSNFTFISQKIPDVELDFWTSKSPYFEKKLS